MKDSAGKTIYVGKAKNLQNRVRTYFAKNRDYKTQKLVEKIADIEFVVTDTEEEAFLLESNLIKRYRPHYNIELRDQQRYTYLRITDEQYPRLLVARRTRSGKFLGTGKTYGPASQFPMWYSRHAFFGSVLHMRTLNDFLSIPMVRSFDVPCVNGPYVFPVPKNFPDLVRLATSSRGYCYR